VNSVPCRAWLEIDLRDTQQSSRDEALKRIEDRIPQICQRRGVVCDWSVLTRMNPAFADAGLVERITEVCTNLTFGQKKWQDHPR